MFALVDAYDAITSKRPYKEPLSHVKAVQIIQNDTGTHFDPVIVKAFLEIHLEFEKIKEKYKPS